jgi:hypothetical protein
MCQIFVSQRLAHMRIKTKNKHTRQHWNLDDTVQYCIIVVKQKK